MEIKKIGRSSTNDIVVNDRQVSRMHCQIIKDDSGNYLLTDLDSENGTFVNGTLRRGEVRLDKSDTVRIGNQTLPWLAYFEGDETPTPIQKNGGLGVAALVCGIYSIFVLAIPFGIIGWARNRKYRELAIAGFILGCAWGLIWIIVLAAAM